MAATYKKFKHYSKNLVGICRNKYDCKYWNTKGVIDVDEQIWLTNEKYFSLST